MTFIKNCRRKKLYFNSFVSLSQRSIYCRAEEKGGKKQNITTEKNESSENKKLNCVRKITILN